MMEYYHMTSSVNMTIFTAHGTLSLVALMLKRIQIHVLVEFDSLLSVSGRDLHGCKVTDKGNKCTFYTGINV